MNYLQEIETGLRLQLKAVIDPKDEAAMHALESIVDFVKKTVLESYRNGLSASKAGRRGMRDNAHTSAIAAGKLKPAKPAQ
jgi:hypothetical protein